MHIPDGFLTPPVWISLDVISSGFVAVALRRVARRLEQKTVPLMGVLAAFVFAIQMINLPIAGGTSAHLLGGVLVSALLGPWAGLLLITVVLIAQCVLFQDGGVAALGSNIFNMGILGSMGGWLFFQIARRLFRGPKRLFWCGFSAGWLGVVLSSFSCALLLAISGAVSFRLALAVIVGAHTILGLGEGIVTGAALLSIWHQRPDLFPRSSL